METTTHINKKEIIQLLIADMRNRKLLIGLEKAGLTTEYFYTSLCYIILDKMGFDGKRDEVIYEWYEDTMQSILEQDLEYFIEKQQRLANGVYQMLLEKKREVYPTDPDQRKAAAQRLLNWFMNKVRDS